MPSAHEVESQLESMNHVTVSPIPKEMRDFAEKNTIRIFNVSNRTFECGLGTLGTFTILPCEPGQKYSKPCSIPGIVNEGLRKEMNALDWRQWSGRDVAADIMGQGPFKHKSNDLARWGVFISAGEVPTEKELAEAKKRLYHEYEELVKEGNRIHAQGPLHQQDISDAHREAATLLNADVPWNQPVQERQVCPGCGDNVKRGIIKHLACGFIFDESAARKAGMLKEQKSA